MNKTNIFKTTAAIMIAGALFTGCKKDDKDTVSPTISVVGSNPYYLQKGTTWTDPSATASDGVDGTLVATPSGTVTASANGTYTITYTAKDKEGNSATATRTVYVVDVAGSYSVVDVAPFPGGTSGTYSDVMTLSSNGSGKVNVTKFGFYTNGGVYFTLTSPTTLTVPSQTVTCGNPAASRNFTGTGTIGTATPTIVTIKFTEVTNGTTIVAQDTYTHQ